MNHQVYKWNRSEFILNVRLRGQPVLCECCSLTWLIFKIKVVILPWSFWLKQTDGIIGNITKMQVWFSQHPHKISWENSLIVNNILLKHSSDSRNWLMDSFPREREHWTLNSCPERRMDIRNKVNMSAEVNTKDLPAAVSLLTFWFVKIVIAETP